MEIKDQSFLIPNVVVNQLNDLTAKEGKLFYYAYHKFRMKLMAYMRDYNMESIIDFDFSKLEHSINIPYEEISILNKVDRVDEFNFRKVKKQLISDSCSIEIPTEKGTDIIFFYKRITFDNEEKVVRVKFNQDIKDVFLYLSKGGAFSRLYFSDFLEIKKDKTFVLYNFLTTIVRYNKKTKTNKGLINIRIEKLKNILVPNKKIDNNGFYTRFVKSVIKEINGNDKLKIKASCKRKKDIITISVIEKKNANIIPHSEDFLN